MRIYKCDKCGVEGEDIKVFHKVIVYKRHTWVKQGAHFKHFLFCHKCVMRIFGK